MYVCWVSPQENCERRYLVSSSLFMALLSPPTSTLISHLLLFQCSNFTQISPPLITPILQNHVFLFSPTAQPHVKLTFKKHGREKRRKHIHTKV